MVEKAEKKAEKKDERLLLWDEYLANYEKANPVKFASKKARGEFKEPPPSFVGKKVTRTLANGKTRVDIY